MDRQQIPFAEWWNKVPSTKGYYKDCQIVDQDRVSERYVLLILQLPLPRGGTCEELVEIDSLIIEAE